MTEPQQHRPLAAWDWCVAIGGSLVALVTAHLMTAYFPSVRDFWGLHLGIVAFALMLLLRRRAPSLASVPAVAAVLTLTLVSRLSASWLLAMIAVVVVCFALGAYGRRLAAGIAVLFSVALAVFGICVSLATNRWELLVPLALAYPLLAVAPALAGLVIRLRLRSATERAALDHARRERLAADRVAELKVEQTRLARDVHDVVGHSLTIILAQAEAGLLTQDGDRARASLRTIADAARASLEEVHAVLATTASNTRPAPSLDMIIDRVVAAGHRITSTVTGDARALDPAAAEVAARVLQELITNALRHGDPDGNVQIVRHWTRTDLRLVVRNRIRPWSADTRGTGRGLAGMTDRLNALGGSLEVCTRDGWFDAAAVLPAGAASALPPMIARPDERPLALTR